MNEFEQNEVVDLEPLEGDSDDVAKAVDGAQDDMADDEMVSDTLSEGSVVGSEVGPVSPDSPAPEVLEGQEVPGA